MQSLIHVPLVVCHVPHVEALKLIIYSRSQSVLWDQRAIVPETKNCCHALVRS